MKSMFILAAALSAASSAHAADPIAIHESSFKDAGGHRVQQLSVIANASLDNAWKAFTTDDGFRSWAVPVTHITLGNDGMMESSYDTASKIGDPQNIRNRIVAYLPEQLIVLKNEYVPKGAPFDPVLIASIRTIITFEPMDGTHTRVTESQVGYGEGAGYDDMYKHFRDGNAYELHNLAQSFISGPIDWKAKEAAKANATVGAK